MNRNRSGFSAAFIARGSVIAALSVAILFLGIPLEVLSLTVATVASLFIFVIMLEYGWKFALSVYATVSVLSFILIPANSASVSYILILGWYPVYKFLLDRKIRLKPLCYLVKILTVLAAFSLMIFLYFDLFLAETDFSSLADEIATFFSIEKNEFVNWLDAEFAFGITHAQAIFLGLYLALIPVFTVLYDVLLTRAVKFYAFKLRPILKKSKLI